MAAQVFVWSLHMDSGQRNNIQLRQYISMFFKKAPRSLYRYGSDGYKNIDGMIDSRGDLLIVSPYIDMHYARKLVARARNGRTYVITSSSDSGILNALGKGGSRLRIAAYTLLSTLLLYALALAGIGGAYMLIAAVPVVIGTAKHHRIRGNVYVRVPRRFVHAKMYISEHAAMIGSANLTYSGMHRNVEHMSIIRSADEMRKLSDQFWELWARS